jgi:hypothetical protein
MTGKTELAVAAEICALLATLKDASAARRIVRYLAALLPEGEE